MTRRTKASKNLSFQIDESRQTRLDLEHGIKSTISLKNAPSDLKKNVDGVKTRAMYKQASENEKYSGIDEIGICSPMKKTKTRQGKKKTSESSIKNRVDDNNINDSKKDTKDNNSNKNKKIFINDEGDFDNVIIEKKESINTSIELDSLLPPTAPESQVSSPIRSDDVCDLFYPTSEFVKPDGGIELLSFLNSEHNTDLSLYSDIISGNNKHKLEGLMKIKLPEKYEYLLNIFQGLEIVLRILERRQKPFFYLSLVKEQVENVTKKAFHLENLQKLLWIAPQLISVRWCKLNKYDLVSKYSNINERNAFNGYELKIILNQGINNVVDRISDSSINDRVNTLKLIMLNFVLLQQKFHLKYNLSKEINVETKLLELTDWSTLFTIESCVDIPKAKLPLKERTDNELFGSSEARIKSLSVTPNVRSLYKFKMISSISNIEDYLDKKEQNNRRSLSADEKKVDIIDCDNVIKTPIRKKSEFIDINDVNDESISFSLKTPEIKSEIHTTPRRNFRSSSLISRSISPIISTPKTQVHIPQSKCPKSVTTHSKNKNLLTPSQKELLFTVRRREKIREISKLINVEDDEYNIKLEEIKNEIWTVQQISFIFLHSKKFIPTTQLPLLAKRLITYARNCPSVHQVQNSILSLSDKFPEVISLGDSNVEKGIKLVKLKIDDENIVEITKKLTEEKNSIINEREKFRLNTMSSFQGN
ncbi:hypothetical protein FG386_000800 [Cryptosporidium ryanae]|uniref:uncharacterized protein n=1 Tax=Cryptosporidium ryanae TaxID=515981 RepID=UPI003519F674|nr:hypothetical protein FG386_000800 [Cryptosporidium ryanae]